MKKILYEQMVPDELIEEKEKNGLAYLPVGSLEWHGPHMGMGVDTFNAYEVSRRAALKTGGVVMPPVFMGTEKRRSPETLRKIGFAGNENIVGMDFPKNKLKSLYWPQDLFEKIMAQYIEMLISADYRLIVMVNGHGADNQVEILEKLAKKYTESTNTTVLYTFALPEGCILPTGHAGLAETAVTRCICPACVELGRLPQKPEKLKNTDFAIVDSETFANGPAEGFTVRYDPRDATAESGDIFINETAAIIIEKVTKTLNYLKNNSAGIKM